MDSDSELKGLYQLAHQLQSVRDELVEKQLEINLTVDKFQERINDVFVKIYCIISAREGGSSAGQNSENFLTSRTGQDGERYKVLQTMEETEDDGFATPAKHPRLDLGNTSENVDDDKTILALEEEIPSQLEHFSSDRFKRTVDSINPNTHHGLKRIISEKMVVDGKLKKTYECFCGIRSSFKFFSRHCDRTSDARYRFRCTLCESGFKGYHGLLEHNTRVHGNGISTQDTSGNRTKTGSGPPNLGSAAYISFPKPSPRIKTDRQRRRDADKLRKMRLKWKQKTQQSNK